MNGVVLLVDDSAEIIGDLGGYLQKMEYKVYTASTIDEAIEIILTTHLDFAVVDLKIDFTAEFGGVQIINFVKKRQPKSKTIVLSAYELDERIRTRFEAEYDAFISKGGAENYILAVLNKLDELEKMKPVKTCFVIMPFSSTPSCRDDQWTEIYCNLFKPAIEGSGYDFLCKRSEALHGNIIEDILDQLDQADVVLADLTDKNPNVFYELGVRHTLRDSTILVSQRLEDIPFDLRPYAIHEYEWTTEEGRSKFKNRIRQILSFFEKAPEKVSSPVRRHLNTGKDILERNQDLISSNQANAAVAKKPRG